jgi:hypothetical protein
MSTIYHWNLNDEKTQWHIDHLLGTVTFAATRMLDVLPVEEATTECRHAIATSKAEMVKSLVKLQLIDEVLGENEEGATISLLIALNELYLTSFSVAAAAAPYHGWENIHEWTPVFQEFQAIVSSAIRYLKANEDRETREDLRYT